MAKLVLDSLTSGYAAVDKLNTNFTAITTALENTLSRDGTSPNYMNANLDMNGFLILNQANPVTINGFNWEGDWVTAQAYQVGDLVYYNGASFYCLVDHTSGDFPTDLSSHYWQKIVQANYPVQTGNANKFLQTNGSSPSWQYPDATEVTYTSPETGAVATTVDVKLQDVVSVFDFGAVGDGVTDDTTAFTNAGATDKDIYVPKGTYYVTASISGTFYTHGKVTIVGGGDARIIDLSLPDTYGRSEWYVRPGFLRQTVSITSGTNTATVSDGTQWRVGDHILISGAESGSVAYVNKYTITGSPESSGDIFIVCDGYIFNSNEVSGGVAVLSTDTATQVADKIRTGSWAGWTVSGSGAEVIFTRNKVGTTVGTIWSDINLLSIPITEVIQTEGTGQLLSKVTAISGNNLTLEDNATATVTNGLCYLEHSTALQEALNNGVTHLHLSAGSYLFNTGLQFTAQGSKLTADGVNNTIIYAVGGVGVPVVEFESDVAGGTLQGVVCEDFFVNLQNARRNGIVFRRLWDGSCVRNVAADYGHVDYVGISVRRHSTQSVPVSALQQNVVSQSVVFENVHSIVRANSTGLAMYCEYVQEMVMTNVKAGFSAGSNAITGTSTGLQLEGCRGVTLNGCSQFGSAKGLRITSVAGEVRGITVIGNTFETNTNNLSVDGGTYDIYEVYVTHPRTIGGGAGTFVVDKCTGGHIDASDRALTFSAATVIGMSGLVYGTATITNSGVNCFTSRVPVISGVITHTYPQGVTHVVGNNSTTLDTTDFTVNNSGVEVLTADYPWAASDLGVVIATNRAGVVTMSRVTIGAANSAGTGYRMLRVLN